MSFKEAKLLSNYGLDDFFINQNYNLADQNNLGRIVSCHKKSFKVITPLGEKDCLIKGSLIHHKIAADSSLPKIGDFVIIENSKENSDTKHFIKHILKRKNELKRKIIGKKQREQIIAANIDYIFITLPADQQFNLRKTERMLTSCLDSQITPIIVLTKADLHNNIKEVEQEVLSCFNNVKVIITSFLNPQDIIPLKDLLKEGKTGALIGSSGSGKSTLTNMILQRYAQKIASVSAQQDKGQHTTTHRELFLLSEGGCIIDSPGIKEFGIWLDDSNSLDIAFQNIIEFAANCKFKDCTHVQETKCAVKEAVHKGLLDDQRLANYLKLKKEDLALTLAKSQNNKKKLGKKNSKSLDNFKKTSTKYNFDFSEN
ncbi:Ribosome small subunit-dependent GTPase A [Candidatus Hepatincolaceae symbiont of Richtersius coronifer]